MDSTTSVEVLKTPSYTVSNGAIAISGNNIVVAMQHNSHFAFMIVDYTTGTLKYFYQCATYTGAATALTTLSSTTVQIGGYIINTNYREFFFTITPSTGAG